MKSFDGCQIILTTDQERHAANCLRIRDQVLILDGYLQTERRLRRFAEEDELYVISLAMSELEKGDGSLTCLSLLW